MRSSSSSLTRPVTLALVSFAVALALTSRATASPTFPAALQAAVPMPCEPQCTVCHLTNDGGFGTLRPNGFGDKLKGFELLFGQPATVKVAVDAARGTLDGDGDQRLDILELQEGGDPNSADPNAKVCGGGASEGPEYGCGGGRVAPGHSIDGLATLSAAFSLIAGAGLLRRRARRG